MGHIIDKPDKISREEVERVAALKVRGLLFHPGEREFTVEGMLQIGDVGLAVNQEKPITEFRVKILVPDCYPKKEPRVFEIGGRIPHVKERHVNPSDESCCVCVWEHWLLTAPDHSLEAYFDGPLYEFFLGQCWYELDGEWPFGEWSHGDRGLIEAFAEILGIPAKRKLVIQYLVTLSVNQLKKHLRCPCGSGKRVRDCHLDDLLKLRERVTPESAKTMKSRLMPTKPKLRRRKAP